MDRSTLNNNTVNKFDISTMQIAIEAYHKMMYPYAEQALEKIQQNTQSFMACLNSQLAQLSPSERNKLSDVDVQIALQNAFKAAARTNVVEIHEILGRLITDRVQKPKQTITELTINQSIEVVAKLDANLIKIPALSFIFSRTKQALLINEEKLIERLTLVITEFKDLDVSVSKFEYLESIACGKTDNTPQFNGNNLN